MKLIHWTPEGSKCQTGINFYWNRHWFRMMTGMWSEKGARLVYFRLRWKLNDGSWAPRIYLSYESYTRIPGEMFDQNVVKWGF